MIDYAESWLLVQKNLKSLEEQYRHNQFEETFATISTIESELNKLRNWSWKQIGGEDE